jgi:hypothetical protein
MIESNDPTNLRGIRAGGGTRDARKLSRWHEGLFVGDYPMRKFDVIARSAPFLLQMLEPVCLCAQKYCGKSGTRSAGISARREPGHTKGLITNLSREYDRGKM